MMFACELLKGDNPDIVAYLIRRDGQSWLAEIGDEIDKSQREAMDKGRNKKSRLAAVKYAAHLCVVRDRTAQVIAEGRF